MKVAIVGAGLAGRLLAWRLVQHCRDTDQPIAVTLCDRQSRSFMGTGRIAAAMVAPFTEAVTTESTTRELGVVSWRLWQKWLPQLEAATGHKVEFNQQGTLVVAHPADLPDWQRFQQKAQADTPPEAMQYWSQSELQQQEPELSHAFRQAMYFPEEGVIDNDSFYKALDTWLDSTQEVTWHEGMECGELSSTGEATRGYLKACDEQFDYVFDCRGNDAREDQSELRSVRGEVVRVHAPEVNLTRAIRLTHPRYPLYIAPRPNHHYVIGATTLESDDDSPVTVRSALELLSALYSLNTGFSEARIQFLQAGLRPAFNDNLPRIVREEQLIRINGLFRHGYLFAPALVDEVIQSLC
ncbi:FAD-dependent oxidoreductase [Leucothrix arctica]|uniref:D-amino-acid oxidase n=1 Tax=Leucothrix arctica TaxID=1481894 RepID=A0A317CKR9_9GAMM|nr:FAD-dependent oxidoreductase [Leucothrix arctica]PWQ96932.1 FAD-dependent oxidoreductase [Leucothrix arctica]